jgi:hypothetical protein
MTSQSTPIFEVFDGSAPAVASWDHARDLFDRVLGSVEDWRELGRTLEALRDEYFAQGKGGGGDKRSVAANANITSAHVASKWSAGWKAEVRKQLGISADTARRYREKARYVAMLDDARKLKAVPYLSAGKWVTLKPSDDKAKLASAALNEVLAGTKKPGCAWAGVCGEGGRIDDQKGSKERKDVDPGKQIRDDFYSLGKWLPIWKKLPLEDQILLAQIARKVRLPELFEQVEESIAGLKPQDRP